MSAPAMKQPGFEEIITAAFASGFANTPSITYETNGCGHKSNDLTTRGAYKPHALTKGCGHRSRDLTRGVATSNMTSNGTNKSPYLVRSIVLQWVGLKMCNRMYATIEPRLLPKNSDVQGHRQVFILET